MTLYPRSSKPTLSEMGSIAAEYGERAIFRTASITCLRILKYCLSPCSSNVYCNTSARLSNAGSDHFVSKLI